MSIEWVERLEGYNPFERGDLILDLQKTAFSVADAHKIVAIFNCRKVTSLKIQGGHLSDEVVSILAKAIGSATSNIDLYLSGNKLGDRAAAHLAEALKNRHVCTLDLSGNQIGEAGALALAAAWKVNKEASLQLHQNLIGPEGAEALTRVAVLPSLGFSFISYRQWNLSDNRLGDEGAKRVAQVLGENPGDIAMLDLVGNGIGIEGDRALAEHLPSSVRDVVYQREEVDYQTYRRLRPMDAFKVYQKLALEGNLQNRKFTVEKPGLIHARKHLPDATPQWKFATQ